MFFSRVRTVSVLDFLRLKKKVICVNYRRLGGMPTAPSTPVGTDVAEGIGSRYDSH